MEVELTRNQQALIGQAIDAIDAIDTGRLHGPEEAAKEAFSLWEARGRRRAEILASMDVSEASLARGEGRVITEESMRQLARDVGHLGRAPVLPQSSNPDNCSPARSRRRFRAR
jgi:hypothetical protein